MRRKLLVAIFVAWEDYWAYIYLTAPTPDSGMSQLGAAIVGLWSLVVVGGTVGMWWWIKRAIRKGQKPF